jgi:hypothetical protein
MEDQYFEFGSVERVEKSLRKDGSADISEKCLLRFLWMPSEIRISD